MIAESCPRALEERAAMRITARSHTCNGAVEFVFHIAVAAGQNLGCVDGRDQHNRASKAGKGGKGRCSFIAATGKALKAFQLAYCLLYPRSQRSFFGKNRRRCFEFALRGIIDVIPRVRAAARLDRPSYPLSVIATRSVMSGARSNEVSNCVVSLASPGGAARTRVQRRGSSPARAGWRARRRAGRRRAGRFSSGRW